MSVKHKKTGQDLKKIDRSKRKPNKGLAALKDLVDEGKLTIKKGLGETKDRDAAPPKPRQGMIPGTEPPHYAELGGLAEVLAEKKEAAKGASKARKKAHDDLVRAMKQRGIPSYVDRGLNLEIRIDITERVKVKKFNHAKAKRA